MHLSCVCFDGPRGAVVSTDGHCLMSRWGKRFSDSVTLLSAANLRQVARMMTSRSVAEFDGASVTVKNSAAVSKKRHIAKPDDFRASIALKPVDAQFPPYVEVMKARAGESSGFTGLDAALVQRTMAALSEIQGKKRSAKVIDLEMWGLLDPVRASFRDESSACTWVAMVMPFRTGEQAAANFALAEALESEKAETERRKKALAEKAIAAAEEKAKRAREAAEEAEREVEEARRIAP